MKFVLNVAILVTATEIGIVAEKQVACNGVSHSRLTQDAKSLGFVLMVFFGKEVFLKQQK